MAMILEAFVSRFGELLSEFAKDEVEMPFGVPGEIEKLQNKLCVISKVLADAERRRINDRAINCWLKELKDVMYDADDILDLCRVEANKRSEGSSSTSSVRFLFPFLSCIRKPPVVHQIGTQIREINQKLEEISRWRSEFNLQISSPDMQQLTYQISRKTSPPGKIDIIGSEIGERTQSFIDLMIKNDRWRKILVFAIVGAGGIGKTTLAKRIYTDQRIQEEFSVKRWVCVSQEFDEIKLLKDILDDNKKDGAGDQSKSSLEPKVESSLSGKKLFLVIDDVWTVKVWWDLLCDTLKSCAAGSRILVTTRNDQVAMEMMAVSIHYLDKLSLEDSWSLLCKNVVMTGEEEEIQHLKDIGMEIVKKCDGLPLAIKVVAGVLCTKDKTRSAWNGVLDSTAWSASGLPEEVKGALYLSYEELPSYLKQCFIYCSLFPEDYDIRMYDITQLWIAEGFVKAEGSLTMEETAEEYYRELILRNLLQPCDPWSCQMHGLLHRLAWYMARDESAIVSKVHKVSGPMKPRHVYVRNYGLTDNEMMEISDIFVEQDSLRTLIWQQGPISETQMDVVFNQHSRLRVLDMSYSKIQRLPNSLGNLIHLRYIDISYGEISMIPEAIGNLRNLQFLKIWFCRSLSCLPNSIMKLHKLRSLDLYDTGVVGMPVGLGRLQNLQVLHGFKLQSNQTEGWCTMEELRSLSCLTVLSVERLEHISSSSEARAANLRNKPKLRSLLLHCTPGLQPSKDEMRRIEEVFEELHPPPCLEELEIWGYFGHEFPKWVAATSSSTSVLFPNLRCLHLVGCNYCGQLQHFGLLPALENLSIRDGAVSIINVGPEFSVGTISSSSGSGRAGVDTSKYAFPWLGTLEFKNMPNWQEWHWDRGTQAMPFLGYLKLEECPKLMCLPEGLLLHATSLTTLDISCASSLTTVENLLSLKELYIKNCPNLEKVSDLPALTTLKVEYCPELLVVENLQSLKRMKLINYDMKSLQSYLLKGVQRGTKKRKSVQIAHLEKLEIGCSTELIKKICQRASPEWPTIQDIQQVQIYSRDRAVYVLYDKYPFSFTTNFNDTSSSSSSE